MRALEQEWDREEEGEFRNKRTQGMTGMQIPGVTPASPGGLMIVSDGGQQPDNIGQFVESGVLSNPDICVLVDQKVSKGVLGLLWVNNIGCL